MSDLPNRDEEEEKKDPYRNPFTDTVLYHTLRAQKIQEDPTNPMFTPQEVELRREQNQYQQRVGSLMNLSGDPRVAAYGGTVLKEALEQAKPRISEHGEYNPLTGEHRYFPQYIRNQELLRNEQALTRATASEAAEDARRQRDLQAQQFKRDFEGPLKDTQRRLAEQNIEVARERELRLKAERESKPIPSKEQGIIRALSADYDNADMISKTLKKFEAPWMGASIVGKWTDRWAEEFPTGILSNKDFNEQREIQRQIEEIVKMKKRHDSFGASVTKAEKPYWDAAVPSRGQDPTDWINIHIGIFKRELEKEVRQTIKGGYNQGQLQEMLPAGLKHLVTPPDPGAMGTQLEGAVGGLDASVMPPQPGGSVLRVGPGGLSY